MLKKIDIEVLNSLTITELTALRYISSNKKDILKMSIQEAAEKNFISTTTIIRLCKKIGFSGFSELKFFIKEELSKQDELDQNLSYENIVNEHIKNIVETKNLISRELIVKAVDKMIKAENIHFFGKGLTNAVASYYSKILFTLGVNNYIYHDTHIAYLAAEKMTKKDLVFIISLSGNTNQAVRLAQIAKGNKAFIISITSNTPNQLSLLSNLQLTFSANDPNERVADSVSRTPALFLFDVIVEVFVARKGGLNV